MNHRLAVAEVLVAPLTSHWKLSLALLEEAASALATKRASVLAALQLVHSAERLWLGRPTVQARELGVHCTGRNSIPLAQQVDEILNY